MIRATPALLMVLAGCSGAGGAARMGADDAREAHSLARTRTANLLGLGHDALPELASLWPALSSRAASEVVESLRVHDADTMHCVQVVVTGDLAAEASEAWRAGARGAELECETGEADALRCRGAGTQLAAWMEGGEHTAARLDALAAEMGLAGDRAAFALACVEDVGVSRLSRIDERLHRAGLLEPWRELHERLGARRLLELRWTRSERGDELAVRYRGDDEAFELAADWAREVGLAGAEGMWQRLGHPSSLAIEARSGPPAEVHLTLTHEP